MQQAEQAGRPRSEIITGVLALIAAPWVAMLYIGRGRQSVVWLLIELVTTTSLIGAAAAGWLTYDLLPLGLTGVWLLVLSVVRLLGLWHVLRLRREAVARPWYSRWPGMTGLFAIAVLVAQIPSLLGMKAFIILSSSMAPRLSVGDNLLTWPIRGTQVARGDIIAFELGPRAVVHIKRVAGLPGDRVQVIGGVLHLNGTAIALTPQGEYAGNPLAGSIERLVEAIPGAAPYYVLNSIKGGSADDTQEALVPDGQLFVLGDHRDNSMDSRFPEFGLIPMSAVRGVLWFVYWNDNGVPLTERKP